MGIEPDHIDMGSGDDTDNQETPLRFTPLDWAALWDTADEGEDWLVEPIIGRGRQVNIYSAPAVGKSLLALEIGAAMAAGGMALGNSFEPTSVVYVDHENDPRGDVIGRLRAMGYSPRHLDKLAYYSFPEMGPLNTRRGGMELLEIARDRKAELVIIDTVSRTIDGEENSNDAWLDLYLHTGLRLKAERIACLRLDHSGKDLSKGMRGGSAKNGDADMVWHLTKQSSDVFRLSCEKSRQHLPEDDQVLTLRRLSEPLRHELAALPRQAAQQARISALGDQLGALNVPVDAGRPAAGQALKDAGVRYSNADLSAAIQQRRKLSEESLGQLLDDTIDGVSGQGTDSSS